MGAVWERGRRGKREGKEGGVTQRLLLILNAKLKGAQATFQRS